MLRIFADALLLVTRQSPMPRFTDRRAEVDEAMYRRPNAPSNRAH